jgi:hypothetical protein
MWPKECFLLGTPEETYFINRVARCIPIKGYHYFVFQAFKRHWATTNSSAAMEKPTFESNVSEGNVNTVPALPNDQPVASRFSFSRFSLPTFRLPSIRNVKAMVRTNWKRVAYASVGVSLVLVWVIVTQVTLLLPFLCTQTRASRVSFAHIEITYQRKNYSAITRTTTNSRGDSVDVSYSFAAVWHWLISI